MHRPQLTAALAFSAIFLGACADGATAPSSPSIPTLAADRTLDMTPATIRLSYFSKSPVVAMAQAKGFFAAENLSVVETQTTSSPTIFRNLRDGAQDVILTQSDNVFNYRLNPSNPLGGTFSPVIFLGTDWGNGASLMARPEFTSVESLRGKTVAVDSPNSGFAFVLYGIMRAHGLEKGVDYNVIVTGGTPGRYADLVAGRFDATILNAGYQFRAGEKGMNTLGGIRDAQNPFMGGSAVALRSWLDANPDVAVRFARAYIHAQQYVLDPAHRDEIISWLTADAAGSTVVAQGSYTILTTPGDGLIPDASLDRPALLGTATLRDSFGGFDSAQNLSWLTTPASGIYDLSFWRTARVTIQQDSLGIDRLPVQ
jgi:ABC-type nitrate/sulfonate/bicarbonate transport system substrate-binding protein